ncbi:hypothetical protein V5O48_012798 [Marasmius crinis-equi]|uniref:F-box domain-containing protein n=1 Tax=Marasmius crinis-equi TaxID=585013 RepID=A0ABR3F2C7_9AGAR
MSLIPSGPNPVAVAAIVNLEQLEELITQRTQDVEAQKNVLQHANRTGSAESSRKESIRSDLLKTSASLEELVARKAELEEAAACSKKRKAENSLEVLSSDLSEVTSEDEGLQVSKKKNAKQAGRSGEGGSKAVGGKRKDAAGKAIVPKKAKRETTNKESVVGVRASQRLARVAPEATEVPAGRDYRVVKANRERQTGITCCQGLTFTAEDKSRATTLNTEDLRHRSTTAEDNPDERVPSPAGQEEAAKTVTENSGEDNGEQQKGGKKGQERVPTEVLKESEKEVNEGGVQNGGVKKVKKATAKKKAGSTSEPEADSEKKATNQRAGKVKAKEQPANSQSNAADAEDVDDCESEEEYVFSQEMMARQHKLETRAKDEVERYLRNPQERLTDDVRTHIRARANHCPEAATSCFALARDCLITGTGCVKCVYHVLVDKSTKKRDRAGLVELTGVPYPPRGIPPTPPGQPEPVDAYNKRKLPRGKSGEEYCHCGCSIEDAVWGLVLWKTGKIQYMGRAHGYEVLRNPPTPGQRNFEITRLKSFGFRLDDFFTHELVAGGTSYRERERAEIVWKQIARLQREVGCGPQLTLDGLLTMKTEEQVEGEGVLSLPTEVLEIILELVVDYQTIRVESKGRPSGWTCCWSESQLCMVSVVCRQWREAVFNLLAWNNITVYHDDFNPYMPPTNPDRSHFLNGYVERAIRRRKLLRVRLEIRGLRQGRPLRSDALKQLCREGVIWRSFEYQASDGASTGVLCELLDKLEEKSEGWDSLEIDMLEPLFVDPPLMDVFRKMRRMRCLQQVMFEVGWAAAPLVWLWDWSPAIGLHSGCLQAVRDLEVKASPSICLGLLRMMSGITRVQLYLDWEEDRDSDKPHVGGEVLVLKELLQMDVYVGVQDISHGALFHLIECPRLRHFFIEWFEPAKGNSVEIMQGFLQRVPWVVTGGFHLPNATQSEARFFVERGLEERGECIRTWGEL